MDATVRYFNRELSWLEFNQRVLEEAQDPNIPLLERLKFLAITASNLDEFTAVRVGSLMLLVAEGSAVADAAGQTPREQLQTLRQRIRDFTDCQYRCFLNDLEPALAAAGLKRLHAEQLTERQLKVVEQLFDQDIFPIFTPMAIDPEADFPLLANQTLNVCVRLVPEEASRFAVIPFGRGARRFLTLPGEDGYSFMLLEDAVRLLVSKFFPGEGVLECVPFRITRNADLEIREDHAADLLAGMQEILAARKESACVRLEVAASASSATKRFLGSMLGVADDEVSALAGPLDLGAFMRLTDSQGLDALRYESWPPRSNPLIDPAEPLFETISRQDVLLYHPYESFEPVLRLLEEAADDPDVLAIKQTLYRTSARSPIVAALKRAAQNGKYVTAVVELKARFDEARNIEWAKDLERADVQVIYGVKGLKTHAKICLIVRREAHGIQRYVHFGTGNYNEITSRIYSDASLMTCDEELGADATSFFNALTGYSQPQRFHKLEVAPLGLRDKLLEMIDIEISQRKLDQKGMIFAKLNAVVDEQLISALYAASQAGVKIRLNVRGICCLRPGVPGLSENITVTSVVDRFLEHSRILYFYHGGDERMFISSADWMPRNLDRRVELLVPVEDAAAKQKLLRILKTHLQDNVKARRLLPDGRYERVKCGAKAESCRSQDVLYQSACDAEEEARSQPNMVFEPHRAPERDS
ncbi:MAG: polyphosphate kinase 1 [Planctomycetaceae bacterium]